MASRLAAAAAPSFTSSSHLAPIISRRGFAGAADRPGREKVNLWEAPMSPMKWKRGQFVIAAVSFWGVLSYGGLKLIDQKEIETEVSPRKK